MAELFIFTVGGLLLTIAAYFEERSRKNARPRTNVRYRSGVQANNRIEKRLYPLFYEQKSNVKSYCIR